VLVFGWLGACEPPSQVAAQSEVVATAPECVVAYSQDFGDDGVVESVGVERPGPTPGSLSERTRDYDLDGVWDRVESWTFDLDGNELSYSLDDGASASMVRWYRYDAAGRLVSTLTDEHADGAVDRVVDLFRGPRGEVLHEHVDLDADGVPDTLLAYTYDDDDVRVAWTRDGNADGQVDRRYSVLFDATGRVERIEAECTFDDSTCYLEVWTWGEGEHPSRTIETDTNADGLVDLLTVERFDAQGRLAAEVVHVRPWEGLPPELEVEFVWDEADHVVRQSGVERPPGTEERTRFGLDLAYADDGSLRSVVARSHPEGRPEEEWVARERWEPTCP
jgi:YD repeat-containing protein